MKKLTLILLAVLGLSLVACKQSVPDQLIKIADQAEAKGASYSTEKWEQVADDFSKLLNEFEENEDSYGPIKKLKVLGAVTKFSAAALKYNVAPEAKKKIEGLTEKDDDASEVDEIVAEGAEELLDALKGLGL